jgi:polyferredoxin/Flp pilus assembly protein TadD
MKEVCESQDVKTRRSIELPVLAAASRDSNHPRNSKTGIWRALSLLTITLLMVLHYIQWRVSGQTISPIEPSETMYTLQNGAINAGFIFFTLAIVATLIFGRFVCGWGCHIVALQDLCAWLMKKIGIVPRPFRSRLLVFAPVLAALYMFVWPTLARGLIGAPDKNVIPNFTNHLVTTDFWATFPTFAVAVPFLFVCGFVTVYFLGSKGFCTYACPYGGFFGIADKFSPGRIRVTDACSECGHCTAVCTSNVIVHAEVKQFGMVVDPGCMKCMDCISVCPTDALYFGFGKPAITSKNLAGSASAYPANKNYSLTWPEEIFAASIFLVSLLATWDVYQLVPMLMALGIAAVSAFLALKTYQMVRGTNTTFLKYILRRSGTFSRAGWVFLSFAFLWLGLVAHSGWIHYHESRAAAAYQKIRIPDELALARPDPARWLGTDDREGITDSKRHYQTVIQYGLFTNPDALPKLAWAEYLSGNNDRAVDLLGEAAKRQSGDARALSLYYRGAILNRLKLSNEALISLDAAIAERTGLVAAREERGEALWQLGKKGEAINVWKDIADENQSAVIADYMLAGAARSQNDEAAFSEFEQLAEDSTPNDALFNWMIGMRLQNLGMNELAETRFQRAIEINPKFKHARDLDIINRGH